MNLSFGPVERKLAISRRLGFPLPDEPAKNFYFDLQFCAGRAFCRRLFPEFFNVFQGYIEGEYVYVASPLGGALTNLAVARGDEVKAGQLLFELERGSEAAAVQQAEKNLAQAKANLVLSEAEFARRQQLRDDQG